MSYEVLLHPRHALKTLENLDEETRARIREALESLEDDPFTSRSGADIQRLSTDDGGDPVYRLRAGDHRCVYVVRRGQVLVTKIFHRSEGYGWMERRGLD